MYLKNPNKKVSYSFRIDPNLLENLKLYSQATNKSVPEILNNLISDKLDGVTLTKTYLDNYNNEVITIPDLKTIYDNTDTLTFVNINDLKNPFTKGTKYTVLKTPNNLDVWDNTDDIIDHTGYVSPNYPIYLHEGIEIYLAPELITPEILEHKENYLILEYCLLFIHFGIKYVNSQNDITLLTFRETMDKIKESNDFELQKLVSGYRMTLLEIINDTIDSIPETPDKDGNYIGNGKTWTDKKEMYRDYTIILGNKLQELANKINTGNIVCMDTQDNIIWDNGTVVFTSKNKTVLASNNMADILEENKQLQERVTELENRIKSFDDVIKGLEIDKLLKKFEELEETSWEEVKKEYD